MRAPTAKPQLLDRERLHAAARRLAARDPGLRALLRRNGPPLLWARRPGFATLLRIVLEQQVSLASARATFRRLARAVDPLTPARLARVGPARLRRHGLTRQKAAYCHGIARAVVDGRLDLRALGTLDDDAVRNALVEVKGIGSWTASIYLLMALRRPDVWPPGDLALARAVQQTRGLRRPPAASRLAAIAETWRPYRAVAARMLWQDYLARRGQS